MSIESLSGTQFPLQNQHLRELGAVALPAVAPVDGELSRSQEHTYILFHLSSAENTVTMSARTRAMTCTIIKENFQRCYTKDAPLDDPTRITFREDSLRLMFKTVGAIDNAEDSDRLFNQACREREAMIDTVDKNYLGDLVDKYQAEPMIGDILAILQTLKMTSALEEDVVRMRKICVYMLEHNGE